MTTPESIRIGDREIGRRRPCFVIAEAGINHNGDEKLAADLVAAAAEAGADAIKFQTHFPEHEMLKGGATAAYVGESLFDLGPLNELSLLTFLDCGQTNVTDLSPLRKVPLEALVCRESLVRAPVCRPGADGRSLD